MNKPNFWPVSLQEAVRQLAKDGLTSSEISLRTGKSRAAIIGWVHRNKIKLKGSSGLRSPLIKKNALAISLPVQYKNSPSEEKQALASIVNTCQWLDGEPRLRVFCQQPIWYRSYCECHARISYVGIR